MCAHGTGRPNGLTTSVTKTQLAALLSQPDAANIANPPATASGSGATSSPTPTTSTTSSAATAPAITINGNNPAHIHVGDTYADLGTAITAPQADLNLGIRTFLNGALVSNIILDTSEVATDTIDYVATDGTGLTATSTRTVVIEPTQSLSIVPDTSAATTDPASASASTTTATSTAQ